LQTIVQEIKDNDIALYIYIYEIPLYTKMFLSKFKTNSMFHSHDTRNKSDWFITSHNTKLFEQSISDNGVLIYSKLFSAIESVKSIKKFRKYLSTFYWEKSFYSVEKFMTIDS
jgi:cyclophilin family peptidyl-prolyl cis-trans isomerase